MQKSPFYHTLLSMATISIAVLKSTCYEYLPVSYIFYSLILHALIDWTIESFLIGNRGGEVRWEKSNYTMHCILTLNGVGGF